MEHIYRERRYSLHGQWKAWFEACPVLKATPKRVTISSENYPQTPLYPGGQFTLNAVKLTNEGKVYHTRHGEYFYLEPPRMGDLFPSQDILNAPDFVTCEAQLIGWDISIPVREWESWRKECWLLAHCTEQNLSYFVSGYLRHGAEFLLEERYKADTIRSISRY